MTDGIPACSSSSMSLTELTPPLAMICIPGNASFISLYNSTAGPSSIPSLLISVHITLVIPLRRYDSIKGNNSCSVVSSQPLTAILRSLASAPRIIFSHPNFSIHEVNTSACNHNSSTFESNFEILFLFESPAEIDT